MVRVVVPPGPLSVVVDDEAAVAPVAVPEREKETFDPDGVRVLSLKKKKKNIFRTF